MPAMPASRVGDMHVCPMVTVLVPHVGGPVLPPCAITVITGGMPQARIGDLCTCVGPPDVIVTGAFTTIVSGMPAARIMDMTAHGGALVLGWFTVIIGDGGGGAGAGSGYQGGGGESGGGGSSDSWDDAPPATIGSGTEGGYTPLTGGRANAPAPASGSAGATEPTPPVSKNVVVPEKQLACAPTLQKQLEELEKAGWKIEYWDGPGSDTSTSKKVIRIDKVRRDDPKALTRTLSHEVGHARYKGKTDTSSREKYVKTSLADEGAATMNNVLIQREMIANCGKASDIGISGNSANAPKYNKIMDDYDKDGDAQKARDAIGSVFGQGEHTSTGDQPAYDDYYGDFYDTELDPKRKKK